MTNFERSYFSIQNIPANLEINTQYILTCEVQQIIDDKATEESETFVFAIISNGKMTQILDLFDPQQNIIFPAINFDIDNGYIIPSRLLQAEILTTFIKFQFKTVFEHANENFIIHKISLKKCNWNVLKSMNSNININNLIQTTICY